MSYAVVYVPEFPVAAWLRRSPELRGMPLALLAGIAPHETVASLNTIAAERGVTRGMSKVQAEAVCAPRFRTLNTEEEQEAFAVVTEIAERFSPRFESLHSPMNQYRGVAELAGAIALDYTGMEALFGEPSRYGSMLHTAFGEAGFLCGVAIAPNADAALMLARSTAGVVITGDEDVGDQLRDLPVTLLPCQPSIVAVLHRWGIRTMGEFACLPETGLVSRLGQNSLRLQSLSRGQGSRLLVPDHEAPDLSVMLELDSSVEDLERLLFVLSRLLGDVLRLAMDRALAVRQLRAIFALEPEGVHCVTINPAHPTQSRETLLKLLNLELQARPPLGEVRGVRLAADSAPPQANQQGLFQSQFPDPERLDILLARLRSIVGTENVGSPVLSNTHREDVFTLDPFRPHTRQHQSPTPAVTRPALRMLRPAQTVRVLVTNDRPTTLFWRGRRLAIADAAGPWNRNGSWWNEAAFDCEVWDVLTSSPALGLRLRHDAASQAWKVVGLYD